MSQLGLLMLQESVGGDREATATTILGLLLLRGQMDGVVDARSMRRRRTRTTLKERFGFKGFGCCGATRGSIRDDDDFEGEGPPSPLPLPLPEEEEEEEEEAIILEDVQEVTGIDEAPAGRGSDPGCLELGPAPIPASSGMNLAAALAAERQFREVNSMMARINGSTNGGDTEMSPAEPGTPWRVSLMRLLEETDGGHGGIGRCDEKAEAEEEEEEKGGGDRACCVCMGRKKGAAFIPCGHTFCRVCSREIWLNRGSCPLCNRSILEILDIF